ncbi:FG-GAP repeat domain-containing protein [Engelhardtia mirabilis]|uniref:FG-GAP repeat protein n=1 Tax=Engelhardtia mirabilis TaxID=2528011 RepID=A0A518BP74_9BACT|nr:FG-GAP repeat protein [Planctomycetes bacterium Pla133]QDV03060.1 FG-GAP repeat protein [Planctomycetes bacterium Pla86]
MLAPPGLLTFVWFLCSAATQQLAVPSAPVVELESLHFERIVLDVDYHSEGVGVGDFDRDGDLDVVAGPYWYEAPDFLERHAIYPAFAYPITFYAFDSFLTFVEDLNADGWDDMFVVGFPGTAAKWYENPKGRSGPWAVHVVLDGVDGESPLLADVDGDGISELVCAHQGRLGFAERDPVDATAPWTFHPVSDPAGPTLWGPFFHGLGLGDVNGDGRADLLTAIGWLEQPPSLAGDPIWPLHPAMLGLGGAQMFVQDVDLDGDGDVLAGWAAHGYGLHWYARSETPGGTVFEPRTIMPAAPPSTFGGAAAPLQFSQLHALAWADVNGDGQLDLVTGKTFYAHNGTDPGFDDPALLVVWLLRNGGQRADYRPVIVDVDSGVGRQVMARDIDLDGRVDIVTSNKKGTYVFLQR